AAPHGNVASATYVVDLARGGESSHAAQLDVDDLRRAEFDGLARVLGAVDRLIQADRSQHLALEPRVVHQIVPPERLLDHHEVKAVERLQALEVVKRVRGVRVGHQSDARKPGANASQRFRVPARLDFYLDALVAGGELALDLLDQLLERVLNADRNAARDFVERSADELGQTHASLLRFNIPKRVFKGGLGHVVTADGTKARRHFTCPRPFGADRPGDQKVA